MKPQRGSCVLTEDIDLFPIILDKKRVLQEIAPENTICSNISFSFFFLSCLPKEQKLWMWLCNETVQLGQQEMSLSLFCPRCLLHMPPGWAVLIFLFAQTSVVSHLLYSATLAEFDWNYINLWMNLRKINIFKYYLPIYNHDIFTHYLSSLILSKTFIIFSIKLSHMLFHSFLDVLIFFTGLKFHTSKFTGILVSFLILKKCGLLFFSIISWDVYHRLL